MTARLAQLAWQLGAVGFLASVVWTIRKARARGKRKFVDEPMARVHALHPDPHNRTDLI